MSHLFKTFVLTSAMPALLLAQNAPSPKPTESKEKQAATCVPKEEKVYVTTRDFKSKLLVLEHRTPEKLLNALRPLGSGFQGASLTANEEGGMKTLSVRDFPENIASIEDALKRLDKPMTQEAEAELTFYVLQGHREAVKGGDPMPDSLAPVMQSLKSTLTYKHYTLAGTFMQRAGQNVVMGSGGLNLQTGTEKKYECSWLITPLYIEQAPGQPTQFSLGNFNFRVHGNGATLRSSLRIKDGETVVVGTSVQDDKGLILVLSAKVAK